ncbi:MAG: hypothetical protein V4662_04420 [Verrucomicrobiota bacterium]
MTTKSRSVIGTLLVICVPGILGFLGAFQLCGIGMCTFIPLTSGTVIFSAAVAVGTVVVSWVRSFSWKVAPVVFTVPMLFPAIVAATSMSEEWRRFAVVVDCVAGAWIGSFLLGSHPVAHPHQDPRQ